MDKNIRGKARRAWRHMKYRCLNPNDPFYHRYGGRGITICDAWMNLEVFISWCDQSGIAEGLSIDRIDNDGDYEPSNCRWVDSATQRENSSHTRWIEFDGLKLTQRQWARRIGIHESTLHARLKYWKLRDALTAPLSGGKKCFR